MSQVWKDGRTPKVTCSARTISGNPCKRPPIKGSNVCRTHGGAAPHVRAKAAVRIMMSADAAAAKLIEMIHSKKVDDRTKLLAVKDLLDRANLSGTQNIEIGVVPKRTFEDFVGDALVDIGDDDPNVLDADVVEDDEYDEPPVQTRHDRAAFREVEQARRDAPRGLTRRDEVEAARRDAEVEAAEKVVAQRKASAVSRGREAYLLALADGATADEAEARARAVAEGTQPTERFRRRQFVQKPS